MNTLGIVFAVLCFFGIFGIFSIAQNLLLNAMMFVVSVVANCEVLQGGWDETCEDYRTTVHYSIEILKFGLSGLGAYLIIRITQKS